MGRLVTSSTQVFIWTILFLFFIHPFTLLYLNRCGRYFSCWCFLHGFRTTSLATPRLRKFGGRMIRCHLSKHDSSTTGASGSHLIRGSSPDHHPLRQHGSGGCGALWCSVDDRRDLQGALLVHTRKIVAHAELYSMPGGSQCRRHWSSSNPRRGTMASFLESAGVVL